MFDDLPDFFRNSLPYFLVLFLVCSPTLADSNFDIKRLMQYDVLGVPHGSKASLVNMEAKSLSSNQITFRNVVLAKLEDFKSIDEFRNIKSKAGALVIMLPQTLHGLSQEEIEGILLLEQSMLTEEITIPIYFSNFNEDINHIITEISRSPENSKKSAAMTELFHKISENRWQLVVSGSSNSPKKDSKIPIIQGELIPFKQSSTDGAQPSSIVIYTDFKAFGLTNDSPPNMDTTVFLTLIDVLSKLYNQISSSAKYRIIFLLGESGSLLNYHALKSLNIEETNVELAICLDSFAETIDSVLSVHVSKPIKEGPVARFYEILKNKAELHQKTVDNVHKKISLRENNKWAHEVFSIKRISAFTLSSVKTHTDPKRNSIFTEYSPSSAILGSDDLEKEMLDNIQTNTNILAEAIAAYIFNLQEGDEIFAGRLAVTAKTIRPYLAPRSLSKSNNVKLTFEKFLKNVKMTIDKPDAREPDFLFYEGEEAKLNVYNVKPAVFDLFLTSMIAIYLVAFYFIIVHFPKFYEIIKLKFSSTAPPTTNGIHKKAN